jgi:hypothetical protein
MKLWPAVLPLLHRAAHQRDDFRRLNHWGHASKGPEGPSSRAGILGRYHRSSSARREPRPPLHQGRPLLAGLHGRYRSLAPAHADRRGPASNRAPRTRGWRRRSEARQSPIRASSVSPAFVHLSSSWKWLLNDESFCPSFVPADNTWLGFAMAGAQGLVRIFDAQTPSP